MPVMNITLIIKGVIIMLIVVIVALCLIFLKNKRKEITLIIISSVIALIVGEFALRSFLPQTTDYGHMIVYDSMLGWKFLSNGKGVVAHRGTMPNVIETNAWGFRDHAPSEKKKKKVMVVGDSFVANVAIEDKEVFTEIIEDKLEEYDVLNFGVSQYGQVQEYLLLEKWINAVDPYIVVVIVYLQNDFVENMAPDGLFPRPFASLKGRDSILTIHKLKDLKIEKGFRNILSKSHVNWLMTRSINNLFAKTDSSHMTEFYSCQSPIPKEYRVAFKIMEELLFKIARLGKEKNVPVIFALAPSILQVDDELWSVFLEKNSFTKKNYIRSSPNDRLMQFAKTNSLQMLDLLPVFLEEEKRNVKCYHPVEQHWTKEGNEVVAKALLDYLNANSLIE
jgi:hypothetical protein